MSAAPPAPGSHTSGPALLPVLGSCVSLQFGAACAAKLFPDLGSWGATTLRLGIAAAILLMISRPAVRRWTRQQWQGTIALGVAMAGMNGTFYAALDRIPLGTAVAIEFVGPLALAAWLSRRPADLAWVGLALAGMLVIGIEGFTTATALDPVGVAFALVAGACWALYIQTGSRVGQLVPGTGGLAVALGLAGLVVAPLGISGAVHVVHRPHLLVIAVGTALLASVIPYTLELAALRRIPRGVFGILLSLEPVVATLAGWALLGEGVGPARLAAIALVVAASLGSSLTSRAGRGPSPEAGAPAGAPEVAGALVPQPPAVPGGGLAAQAPDAPGVPDGSEAALGGPGRPPTLSPLPA